ncbi:glycosyltransferase family 4 protein [Corynebacterium mendelii]|uniref:Glycosyltransferase family 4 protein n=1 Tax=Corynebacterium mendelii TaxID=2765362 RepID=A0A939IWI8_9CORY|nr:glycosyltransferase family 4 protein [Corynebacterium mendelii]MBN9643073.1 glycosyltransferase family 4 protein [Corynebacterium mendelii]
MGHVLVVTNDFPPAVGGIQSYVRDFAATLPPEKVTVLASSQTGSAACTDYDRTLDYEVVRIPKYPILPTAGVKRMMRDLVVSHDISTVWFAAAAPLALLAPAATQAGARSIVASTHGHETGWAKSVAGRAVLRRIGAHCDTVTYISDYTKNILKPVMSAGSGPDFVHLPSGVDTGFFRPATDDDIRRTKKRFGFAPTDRLVVCVSRLVPRKGQDQLIRAANLLAGKFPDMRIVIVGEGPDARRQKKLAATYFPPAPACVGQAFGPVVFTGRLDLPQMRDLLAAAVIAAVPCRTRWGGLDVEGLGIVYLEAQACGIPVIAGNSGGAPETVLESTGVVVDGRSTRALAAALDRLLADPETARDMGAAGREHVETSWTWDVMGARLKELLRM